MLNNHQIGYQIMALAHKILQVISGEHVAAVATISDGHPAVRFMALNGFNDLSLTGAL